MPYQITEPHPTARPNTYTHTGRGGAGNMYKVTASTPRASAPLAKISSHTSGSSSVLSGTGKLSTGRGGAGNIRKSSDLHAFSFDDELALQSTIEKSHDVWHVGRGGAGNWSAKDSPSTRKLSNDSADSASSRGSGFFGRISGAFERN
jgi:hypothetical protein